MEFIVEIKCIAQDNICILRISGSVDSLAAPELNTQIDEMIEQGYIYLVINLSAVDFMSSAGLRSILMGLKESRDKNGDLYLSGIPEGVSRTMRVAGLTNIISIFKTDEDAILFVKKI